MATPEGHVKNTLETDADLQKTGASIRIVVERYVPTRVVEKQFSVTTPLQEVTSTFGGFNSENPSCFNQKVQVQRSSTKWPSGDMVKADTGGFPWV